MWKGQDEVAVALSLNIHNPLLKRDRTTRIEKEKKKRKLRQQYGDYQREKGVGGARRK